MCYNSLMSIFKTKAFARDARTQGLTDAALVAAVGEVRAGLVDAELGGNLVKKRIAVGNKGKSGGLRTILVYKAGNAHEFCMYLFAKSEKANITPKELQELKTLAKALLGMSDEDIEKAVEAQVLIEVEENEDEEVDNEEE
jgi:hypothetical protein